MAKEKKLKVPKRIAGVKVPKKARKTANKALALAENPMARQLAVAALTAAAAAVSEKKVGGADGQVPANDEAGSSGIKLGDLVAVAALEGARRLLDKAQPAAAVQPAPAAQAEPAKAVSSNGAATGSA